MGYDTWFNGEFDLTPALSQAQITELKDFEEPEYIPGTKERFWTGCHWVPNTDGTAIVWDETQKFYDYYEWTEYIIEKFLVPWGITCDGEVYCRGDEFSDFSKIVVNDNKVTRVWAFKECDENSYVCDVCGRTQLSLSSH